MLVRETYPDKNVAAFMRKNFISLKINAEKGEGPELSRRFGITGFPTMLLVDPTGQEVDRVGGFLAPAAFLTEFKSFVTGKAFGTYKKRLKKDPNDFEAAVALGRKYETRKDNDAARALYNQILQAKKSSTDLRVRASARLSLFAFMESGGTDLEEIRKFFDEHRKTAHVVDHAVVLLRGHMQEQNTDKVIEVADYLVEYDEARRPMILNAYAWYLASQKAHLEKALALAKQAVELSPDDAYILDTLAEVYFQQDKFAEAVTTQEKALANALKEQRTELEQRLNRFRAALKENS